MPAPRILVFVNQKGGPGKTTLAMSVAGELGRRGLRVLVADVDPQGTASRWAASAPADTPFPATVEAVPGMPNRLHGALRARLRSHQYLLVDCPPSADSPISHAALLLADLAIVPVVPSPPDLWAGLAIRQVIQSVQSHRPAGPIARLVINRRKAGTRLATQIRDLLPQYGIPAFNTFIGEREAYRHAAAGGCTVRDLRRAQVATAEIFALTEEILALLSQEPSP